ncbi:MAG: RNA polymerase factor sigma-54 [Ignavibacteriae bacterium]|nr:RNA polymerase factor sigma-54 [Ignavibacteria bacterium]MBI3364331.1 RNA polymerase factor sigma-54 [Ignavibacteriota bacterium]
MLNITQRQTLQQKLTPQQVQYLQLLQLPLLSLEQRIKAELEMNPLLEEVDEMEMTQEQDDVKADEQSEASDGEQVAEAEKNHEEDSYTFEDFMNDELDGHKATAAPYDGEDRDEMPQPAEVSLTQRLHDQILLLDLAPEEIILAEEIIGNIDEDGYLRRDLPLIVQDLNLSQNLAITNERADEVLLLIQRLDPPGIAARTLQECLIVQLEVSDFPPNVKEKALKLLRDYFDDFTMKHYEELAKKLGLDLDRLKPIIELIQKLNPKPGEGEFTAQQNYIVPDFIVDRDGDDFIVTLNDRNVPPLRINKAYKELMSRKKKSAAANGVKDFIRKRFEAAKWFINSINQRRDTMLRVMRTIIEKQRVFFETGEGLRPMIYKDIAEVIGMDISTISRVVNGKYVQTEYGVFELRHFFSDKLTTTTGEEVSNKEVKKQIKEIIDSEDPHQSLSDDRIAEILNKQGLNIARRTVAKYREAMRIPVARLRRKI